MDLMEINFFVSQLQNSTKNFKKFGLKIGDDESQCDHFSGETVTFLLNININKRKYNDSTKFQN